MQKLLKNSESHDINTAVSKTQFHAIANELAHQIDEPALSRAYVYWCRHCEHNADGAREYLETQLPDATDIILSASEMNIRNACKWLASQKLTYRETISGVAVSPATYDSLCSFIRVSQPLRPAFDRFCSKHNIDSTPSSYHQFCRFCGKKIIKIHCHPVHTCYSEFWMYTPAELTDLLEQWAGMTSGIENNVTAITSDITQHYNGIASDMKRVDALIKSVCKIPTRFLAEVKRTIYNELQASAWIINPQANQTTQYYYQEHEVQVAGEIQEIVSPLQIRPLSNLKAITGLSLKELKAHVAEDHIHARKLEARFYISADEENRVRELSEKYVSLDEVVNLDLSGNDCSFTLTSSKDRNALINHMMVNQLFDAFCVDDPTMPLDSGYTGFFIDRKDVQELGAKLVLWFRGYKQSNGNRQILGRLAHCSLACENEQGLSWIVKESASVSGIFTDSL